MYFVSRPVRSGANRKSKLLVEQLEDRALPSVSITEPSDSISDAFDTGITGAETEPTTFLGHGTLGDNTDQPVRDQDYMKIKLQGGERIAIGIAYLGDHLNRAVLLDQVGQPIETEYALGNDPRIPFPTNTLNREYRHYTVQQDGTYYVAIQQLADRQDEYDIEIRVVPRVPLGPPILGDFGATPSEPNDTINDASVINVNGGILNGYYQSGLLGNNPHLGQDAPFGNLGRDVDLYKLVIPADFLPDVFGQSRVRIDVNTITTSFQDGVFFPQRMPEVDNLFLNLPSLRMRVFDEVGTEITGQLDLFLNGSVTSGLNLAATFPAPVIDTTYYLGIDLGHDYDPTVERSEPAILAAYDHEIPYVISVLRLPPIIDPGLPDTDIAVRSAAFQSGNTVQFTYETQGDTGAFEVGLYRSMDGITYNPVDLITTRLITPTPNGGSGSGTFASVTFPPSNPDLPYLLVVADPGNAISESDESNNSVSIRIPDVVVRAVDFNAAQGGADITYDVVGDLSVMGQIPTVAVYWARGDTPVGATFFTADLDATQGIGKKLHIPLDKLTNLPFSTDPARVLTRQNLLDADHLRVVADPNNLIQEANEDNNAADQRLFGVTAKPDFMLQFTHPVTGTVYKLNTTLFQRVLKLTSDLVAQNAVTADITLNEGVRDPRVAHQWSTSWMIRYHPSDALLRNLMRLRDGKDLDGNLWYDRSWESLVRPYLRNPRLPFPRNPGQLSAAAKQHLWNLIQRNALMFDTRSNKSLEAADGYARNDPHRHPNTHGGGITRHVLGLAIDASINWRSGILVSTGVITTGETSDLSAQTLVTLYGLSRPVGSEKHHFELA